MFIEAFLFSTTRRSAQPPARASSYAMSESSLDQPRVPSPGILRGPAQPKEGRRLVVFVHGWPDSPSMFEAQLARLASKGHRCIALPLPGYPLGKEGGNGVEYPVGGSRMRCPTFEDAVRDIAATIISHLDQTKQKKVVLVCHDWGCVVGLRLWKSHADIIDKIALLDVAADMDPSLREWLFIVAYQLWLAAACLVGGGIGSRMTTVMAKSLHAPSTKPGGIDHGKLIPASRNWPYVRYWQEAFGALRTRDSSEGREWGSVDKRRGSGARTVPACPVLFMYGGAKPVNFHSERWLRDVEANGAGSGVVELKGAGHWFPVTHANTTSDVLDAWISEGKVSAVPVRSSL